MAQLVATGEFSIVDSNDGYSFKMSAPSVSIPCNADGTNPVLTYASTTLSIYRGQILQNFTISSITSNPANVVFTKTNGYSQSHNITITSIPTDSTVSGYLRINFITYDGYASYVDFSFAKQKQGDAAYALILSNENQSIGFDAAGNALAGELGLTGKAQTAVNAYKGTSALVITTATPTAGQYKIVSATCISGTAVAVISGGIVYISSLSSDTAVVRISVLFENISTITKDFTLVKSKKNNSNLLDWQNEWTTGSGILTGGWSNNGDVGENLRLYANNPFGVTSLLWKCLPSGNSNGDGGWTTNAKALDRNYAYRYSVFVYKTKNGGSTYHGCGGIVNLDGTANSNPYFLNGITTSINPGQWYLMVGVVHPNSVTDQSGITGLYDMNGVKVIGGTDFKFASSDVSFRSFLYYCTDVTINQFFYNPMLHRIDGNEPSIENILQLSTRTVVDSAVTILNNSISSKVSQTVFDSLNLNSRLTTAEQKITPDAIISTVQSTIDQASIGNRNIMRNSDFSNGKVGWSSPGATAAIIDNATTFWNNNSSLKFTCPNVTGTYDNISNAIAASLLKTNTTYTLSCYAKWDSRIGSELWGPFIEGNIYAYTSVLPGTASCPWTRFSVTFTTNATNLSEIRAGWYFNNNYKNTANVWLTMFKLEEGSVATAWCLAPEDTVTKTQITQTNNSINLSIINAQIAKNLLRNTNSSISSTGIWVDKWFWFGNNDAESLAFVKTLRGQTISLSVGVDITSVTNGYGYYYVLTLNYADSSRQELKVSGTTTQTTRLSSTFTIYDKEISAIELNLMAIQTGIVGRMFNPKVELGSTATAWSPCPDDKPASSENLIPNSANIFGIGQKQIDGTVTYNQGDKDGTNCATKVVFSSAGSFMRIGNASGGSILQLSTNIYTYSIWVYPMTNTTSIKMGISATTSGSIAVVPYTWQRISFTLSIPENAWYITGGMKWYFVDVYGQSAGDTFLFYRPKFEVGSNATDWSPKNSDVVTKDNILSSINMSQEAIKIKAALIALEGLITANDNFKIRADGVMEATGAIIQGMIKALSGNIGDFSIVNGDIIGCDTSDTERVRLTTSAIPALASLSNVWELIAGGIMTRTPDSFFRSSRPEEGDPRDKSSGNYYFSHTFSLTSTGYIKVSRAESAVTTDYSGALSVSVEDTIKIYKGATLLATVQPETLVYMGVTGEITCVIQTSVSISNMPHDKTINLVVKQGYDGILKQKSSEKTMIGSNGFYSMFDISKFIYFNKDYGFDVQFGNSRLRLTASGIQKSINGGTSWTSL